MWRGVAIRCPSVPAAHAPGRCEGTVLLNLPDGIQDAVGDSYEKGQIDGWVYGANDLFTVSEHEQMLFRN